MGPEYEGGGEYEGVGSHRAVGRWNRARGCGRSGNGGSRGLDRLLRLLVGIGMAVVLSAALAPAALADAPPGITQGTPRPVTGALGLYGMACTNTTSCVTVGQGDVEDGFALPLAAAGTPGTGRLVAGPDYLYGVACPSATSCIAVGISDAGGGIVVPIAADGTPGTPDRHRSQRTRRRGVSDRDQLHSGRDQ